jgi:hypothetical protein
MTLEVYHPLMVRKSYQIIEFKTSKGTSNKHKKHVLTVAANPTHKFCWRSKARTIIVPWAVMSWWWCA